MRNEGAFLPPSVDPSIPLEEGGVGAVPACVVIAGWSRAKLELGIHGEKISYIFPLFLTAPLHLPHSLYTLALAHVKICVLHVAETI